MCKVTVHLIPIERSVYELSKKIKYIFSIGEIDTMTPIEYNLAHSAHIEFHKWAPEVP